ncbi:unnamed protein product [Cuscuta campestris]|uniref:Uncharacterized protein n=1 Tax=Cuscuta campestris TaxID=132261 RepID=A0A484NB79_9ASTE|nr:unnamed protein product [Cuscuta campestris]
MAFLYYGVVSMKSLTQPKFTYNNFILGVGYTFRSIPNQLRNPRGFDIPYLYHYSFHLHFPHFHFTPPHLFLIKGFRYQTTYQKLLASRRSFSTQYIGFLIDWGS